jgi:YegS/Rv2252/BmrU family lipid kinase
MDKKINTIHVIINPASGTGQSILPILNASMKEAGITWDASITHQAGDAIRYAKAAVKEGVDALAVYGGDGTLMEAISGLIGSEIPLAILPGGSANVLANELGIPADLKEACMLLSRRTPETKSIDVGQFNKRYFIVGISLGFASDVVKGAARETKNVFGVFAYLFSAVKALRKAEMAVYNLTIDGQEHEVQGITCIITNTGHLGFTNISVDKHIDVSDGYLDVLVVRKANISLLKLLVVTLFTGERPDNLELVEHWQGKEISVSSNPGQTVQCDGEVVENIPLHITIIPAAIKVLVPDKKGRV